MIEYFQVPVAEILARAAPSAELLGKPKSSNFLQVPDLEGPRYNFSQYDNVTKSIKHIIPFTKSLKKQQLILSFIFFYIFRPKSVPNSPSFSSRGISRFSHLRNQISSAWSSASTKSKKSLQGTSSVQMQGQLHSEDKKKWPSAHDCRGQ